MSDTIRVTVLAENTVRGSKLLAEHGLAFWIEDGERTILFDTGQGAVLASNAYRLGVCLDRIDAIVLSHGHYDHTGGLPDALRGSRPAPLYAHPDAMKPKFACGPDGTSREIGIPAVAEETIRRRGARLLPTEGPTAVTDHITVTGPVPRNSQIEDTGGPFFLDPGCQTPDPLIDDQAVFFDTQHGTVVLLGCAHAGVVNTLEHVRSLTSGRPIHAVLGGMHLVNASPARLKWTIDQLRRMEIDSLGPAHCTGCSATAALWSSLPDRCIACHVGSRYEFWT